jgi:hypothetical protein
MIKVIGLIAAAAAGYWLLKGKQQAGGDTARSSIRPEDESSTPSQIVDNPHRTGVVTPATNINPETVTSVDIGNTGNTVTHPTGR